MTRKDDIIAECLQIKAQKDELDAKDKALRMELQILLQQEGLKEYVDSSENIATYSTFERKSLDRKLVEAKMAPEDFEQCFKISEVSMLKIISKDSAQKIKAAMGGKK